MGKLTNRIRRALGIRTRPARPKRRRRRSDSYAESLIAKEIEEASPERAGEIAGHPVERVDT